MHSITYRWPRVGIAFATIGLMACAAEPMSTHSPRVEDKDGDIEYPTVREEGPNAAVHWNEVSRNMVASTGASTPFAIRGYTIVSVAQYNAAVAAEREIQQGRQASVHAAISAASVAALSYLFPAHADALEAQLEEFLEMNDRRGRSGDAALGIAVGRAAAATVVEDAKTDNFFAPWTGTVPTGEGKWYSSTVPPTPPAGAAFGQARTYMLTSGSQFRPAPHPAFGSATFNAALAEVRSYSDNRTPAQDSLAKFWHLPAGTYAPPGYWNDEAAKLALKYRMSERRSAHVLALMNIVMYDALIASHEAKYHYWLLRPSQADPAITTSVGLPNFPSYPSNHAAISSAAAQVLGRAFIGDRVRLRRLGEEAAFSRVVGGIHYRFDGDAGLVLGRTIADYAMRNDVRRGQPYTLR